MNKIISDNEDTRINIIIFHHFLDSAYIYLYYTCSQTLFFEFTLYNGNCYQYLTSIKLYYQCLCYQLLVVCAVKPLINLLDTAESLGATRWASYIRESGLANELETAGAYTLFAPTNEAFDVGCFAYYFTVN